MNLINKSLILILFAVINNFEISAQEELLPPSPEAALLGSYSEIPVNYYTGTPNIHIPIWEVTNHSFSLPISLSYRTSGNRVNDIASRIGLGWTLKAGGVITRCVRGLPDDRGTGSNNGFYFSQNFDNGEFQQNLGSGFISYVPSNSFIKYVAEGYFCISSK
jgi:hypothetical protein